MIEESYSDKYPELYILFCGYYNQDWNLIYNTKEEAINTFIIRSNKEEIIRIIKELKILLEEQHTKKQWDRIMVDEFECVYDFEVKNIELFEWLSKIQKQLEDELILREKGKTSK